MILPVIFKNQIQILHFYSLLIVCLRMCMRFRIFVILLENKEKREVSLAFSLLTLNTLYMCSRKRK